MINSHRTVRPVRLEQSALFGVEYASWLSHTILLVAGRLPVEETATPTVTLVSGKHSVPLAARHYVYSGADGGPAGALLTIAFPQSMASGSVGADFEQLTIRTRRATLTLAPPDLAQVEVSIQKFVGEALAGLDPATRSEIVEFFAATTTLHTEAAPSLRLSRNLLAIREALREKLPLSIIAKEYVQTVHVEAILAIDERSYYIRGWMRDAEAPIAQLSVVSPEGSRAELIDQVFSYVRPDLHEFYDATFDDQPARLGFLSYFELKGPSSLSDGWIVEMHNTEGHAVETKAPLLIRDGSTIRTTILGDIYHERLPDSRLLPKHIFPALSRLQERHAARVEVESVLQFGRPPETPEVSIVVPLYGRIDFLEQQLAQFVHDPEIQKADLLYVLDSPELADGIRECAPWLFKLYRVPFRVAILKRNAGFSAANNVGASLARGRLLLLLNSDVLPATPGWLGTLVAFYDTTPGIGALAPKLLYEDDSLQHAGLYFRRTPHSLLWNNEHYFKGLHRRLPAANTARPVPAVTAACMLIDRERYDQLGGLRGIYVQGDFEDSDLCLRLAEAGYQNWYLPDAELYHLEGQSYPAPLRRQTGRYNMWLHTHLWNERIEALMRQFAPAPMDEELAA